MTERKNDISNSIAPKPYMQGKKYELLLNYVPFGLGVVDSSKKLISRNLTFNYLFSLSDYDDDVAIIVDNCTALTSSGFSYFVDECFERKELVETEIAFTTEYEQVFCKVTLTPFYDNKGNVEHLTATIEDITKQRLLEQSIFTLNEKIALHRDNSPLAYIVFDTKMNITEWNIVAEQLFEYSADDVLGLSPMEVFFHSGDNDFLDDFKLTFKKNQNEAKIYKIKTRTGNIISCQWHNAEIINHSGTVTGYTSLVLDITKQLATEKALLENEKIFRTVVENQADGIVQVDPSEVFKLANPAMGEILECNHKSLIGQSFLDYVVPDSKAVLLDNSRNRQAGVKNTYEVQILTAESNLKWISISATPQLDKDGQFIGSFGIIKDITSRKRAELQVLENQARFNTILTYSKDLINILDADLHITYFSPNAKFILESEYTVERLLSPINYVHPEDREQMNKLIEEVFSTPEEPFTFQYRYELESGAYIWLESIAINLFENPTINGVLMSSRDISGRIIAEEARRQSEKNLRTVVNNANVLIFILDKNGVILLSEGKALELFKFKPGQIVGLSIFEIFEDDSKAISDMELAFQGYEIKSTFTIQSYIFESIYSPYYDHSGTVSGVVAIASDVTERIRNEEEREQLIEELQFSRETIIEETNKLIVLNDKLLESEAQLSKSNAEKDKFFSIISHDLRSPLSGIMGLAETVTTYFEKYSREDILDSVSTLLGTSKHLYKLLDNLLLWSRVQRGVMEFMPDSVSFSSISKSVIELLKYNAMQKGIELIDKIPEELYVFTDLNMANTILRNLVSNAIKFTTCGGTITIHSDISSSNFAEIKVTDTGVGMSQEIIDKLFRLDTHHTSLGTASEQGTGLGLILCKEMAEKNGGSIRVESEEGKGTTFAFTIPLSDANITIINDSNKTNDYSDVIETLLDYETPIAGDELVLEELPPETLALLPTIIEVMETELLETRNTILNTLIISDIIDFSKNLKQFAEDYQIVFIQDYANKLYDKCKMMDIRQIDAILNQFTGIIDKLKQYQ